jgi:hypothetical protein
MNPLDDQLDRLFRAARSAAPAPDAAPPYGMETRVLAAWRAAGPAQAGLWDMAVLVKALIVASIIMAISLWPALNTTTTASDPYSDYQQLADSTAPTYATP